MHSQSVFNSNKVYIPFIILLTLVMAAAISFDSTLESQASPSRMGFYSPESPPNGVESLEPLMAKWWNWRTALPTDVANNWPECLKGDGGTIGNNQSVVFVGDPVAALAGTNENAKNQKCEISSNQLLYLTVYAGECSTGSKPHEGEFPDTKSPAALLDCAKDSNLVMKLMQVKVDGEDVSSNIVRQTTTKPFNYVVPLVNAFDWQPPLAGGNNSAMAENYYLFFQPMPVGDHTIELKVIKQPPRASQPIQNLAAKWDFKVVP
jgi:hypothetical protein